MVERSGGKRIALKIATVGICAATLECVKLALAALPNIEAVTLLCALYGYVFGSVGIAAAVVFVCIEPIIWGFGSWVVSYFIYWPVLAFVFMLLGKKRVSSRIAITAVAVIATVRFGVLTSLVDVGLFTGYYDRFFIRFSIYYARGAVFYILQTVTNAVLFPLLFPTMAKMLKKVKI